MAGNDILFLGQNGICPTTYILVPDEASTSCTPLGRLPNPTRHYAPLPSTLIACPCLQAGIPAGYAPTAAISQWGRAAYGFPAQLTGHEDPTNPEFANWAHVYAGLDYATAGALFTDAQAGVLLPLFQGTPALDQPGWVRLTCGFHSPCSGEECGRL